jgi:hypothetical protein
MPVPTSSPTTSEVIVQEAATVVAEAVRAALVEALHAAEVCRCRQCRARAVRTFTWATALLAVAPETGVMTCP